MVIIAAGWDGVFPRSQQLTETPLNLKHQCKLKAVRKGWKVIPEWVFITDVGTLIDASDWRKRVFEKTLVKVGLRKVRIHDLRHTFASLLIQAGGILSLYQGSVRTP